MATVEVHVGPVAPARVEPVADALMDGLAAHPAVVGPMVVADAKRGDVAVSFDFAASGDAGRDRPQAMDILEAVIGGNRALSDALRTAPVFNLEVAYAL